MEKDNKKQEEQSKITSFEITDDMLSDPEFDLFLKEDMIREADEIEKEMDQDEALRGVGASDDLFQSIVHKLKEQKVWEEDELENREVQDQESAQETQTASETESMHANKAVQEPQNTAILQKTNEKEVDTDSSREIYDMLSEEDRLNLEAGKAYRRQKEVRRKKKQKRARLLKRCGMVAAVFAVVFGLGLTSEANRRLVLKAWDGLKYNFNFRLSTNYLEEDSVRSKTREEIEAMEEIKKRIGAPAIDFQYLPKGMEYEGYNVIENNKEAYIFYSWKGKIINIFLSHMQNADRESSMYVMLNQDAKFIETIKNDQDLEIHILETDQNAEKPSYVAELQYNDFRYIVNEMDSLEEIKKIAKYSVIL